MPYLKTADDCSIYYEVLGEGTGKPTITFVTARCRPPSTGN